MPNSISIPRQLPTDALRFRATTATSGLNRLGEFRLNVVRDKAGLSADNLLGKPASINGLQHDKRTHFSNGNVSRTGKVLIEGSYVSRRLSVHGITGGSVQLN